MTKHLKKGRDTMIVLKSKISDNIPEKTTINLPRGVKILSFDIQKEAFCIWWLADIYPEYFDEWEIVVIGTGNNFNEGSFNIDHTWQFIGTSLIGGSSLVFHCFAKQVSDVNGVLVDENNTPLDVPDDKYPGDGTVRETEKLGFWEKER